MADEEMRNFDDQDESDASESSQSSAQSKVIESLVAGREKRSTAANKYNSLLQQEEVIAEEDEVNLLFADDENEEDEEFEGEEEGDDALSSSDDEDQGLNAPVDELEGERALEKQEKAEKAKKRKAVLDLTTGAGLRKKVKIDPNLPAKASPVKKPSKKKERTSWIPADINARTSLRKQTVIRKEVLYAKMAEDEKKSAKLKAIKAKRDRERAHKEVPVMTQADRLAEAERVERRNLKSLNRWEETEKKRAQEQMEKLAALKNRTLEGPVITWWSGKAKWAGPRLSMIGSKEATQVDVKGTEPKKRGRKSKAYHEQMAREAEAGASSLGTPRAQSETPGASDIGAASASEITQPLSATETAPQTATCTIPQAPDNFLHGIQEYATMQDEEPATENQAQPDQTIHAPLTHEMHSEPPSQSQPGSAPPTADGPAQSKMTPIEPPPPPVIEHSTRNLVILDKFGGLHAHGRGDYNFFYNHRKSVKPIRVERELCTITSNQAKYRDPDTGLAYANSYAYKKIQELKNHGFVWSSMLGCFVGRVGVVARGVPDDFIPGHKDTRPAMRPITQPNPPP